MTDANQNDTRREGEAGPGLPDSIRLGGVHLHVSELGRSIDWYREILGFDLLHREGTSAQMGVRGRERPLLVLDAEEGVRPTRPGSRLGLFHFAILLPAREALGRFVGHLAAGGVRVGASDHGVSEALYLTDRDGLGVEVYADRPRERWEWGGGQVRMTTEPLDLEDLRSSGGGGPWEGLPEGTTLGHIHLHVGSLEEAEAFYHRELGLDVTARGYPGALFLAAGGYHHHLGVNRWAGPVPAPGPGEARLDHWTLELPGVDSVETVVDRFRRADRTIEEAGEEGVLVCDPWGTRLHLRVVPS